MVKGMEPLNTCLRRRAVEGVEWFLSYWSMTCAPEKKNILWPARPWICKYKQLANHDTKVPFQLLQTYFNPFTAGDLAL